MSRFALATYRTPLLPMLGLAAMLLALAGLLLGPELTQAQNGAPTVTGVAVSSVAGDDDTYLLGETIRMTLTFSETVNVTGTPRLKIDMDPADWGEKWAGYDSGSGTASLTFTHEVVEPNLSTQGIAVLENTLELNGGSIKSASSQTDADLSHTGLAHNPRHKVDWRRSPPAPTPTPEPTPTPTPPPAPAVTEVEITSNAGDDDTYLLGETIRITVTFSEVVDVTGAPRLKIDMDPAEWGEKQVAYHSGSGTAQLTFAHTVVEPNLSTQGISVLENSLELNGGVIKSASSDTDAELSHDGRDHDPSHKVDWQRSQPNRAPVVNIGIKNYEWFIGRNNAPRGVLVSKSFYEVFTDPDGDELAYSVAISDHHQHLLELLDEFSIGLDYRTPENSHRPLEAFHRVWFRAEDDTDWKGKSPALADPVLVTATVTVTDPEGLSVSLDGDFLIWWESHPEVVSAAASEQAIELTFDVAVLDDPAPTPNQFTVNVASGSETAGTVTVNGVSVDGSVVTLGLASELLPGQTVTVDYAHDTDTPLKRDSEGGDHAPGFTGQAVTVPLPELRVPVCDRTPEVRDVLARYVVRKDCADITAADLVEVDRIRWPYLEDITSLKSGDFEGLYNLEGLTFRDHQLTSLPEDIFDGLHSLQDLNIWVWAGPYSSSTGLTALPEDVFADLSNLKELKLSGNRLRTLPDGVFDGLSSLQTLNLQTTSLTALSADVFDDLSSLQTLILDDNELSTLPDGVFDGLSSLRTLDLNRNDLAELPEFDGLSSLQTLILDGNKLSTLPDGVFDGLSSLQALHWRGNDLTALSEDAFDGLSNLQTLDLGSNDLTALPEDAFDGLSNLQTLILDANQLTTALPEDLFDGLTSLQTLNLRRVFHPGYAYIKWRMEGIDVTALPEDLFDGLTSLQTLNLGSNHLRTLPEDVFDGLSSLQTLDLSGNSLTELPEDVFDGLSSLQTLDLHWNHLTELPEEVFDGLSSLQTLELWVNRLSELPEDLFDGLSSLQTLNLRNSGLSELSAGYFDGLTNLQELDLSDNNLSELSDDLFDGLTNLQELHLYENDLAALSDGVFTALTNLRELNLYENDLSTLSDGAFTGLTNLRELNLSQNALTTLSAEMFNNLPGLLKLDLSDNPGSPFGLNLRSGIWVVE